MLRKSMKTENAGLEKTKVTLRSTLASLQSVISSNDKKIKLLTQSLQEKDKMTSELLSTIEDLYHRLCLKSAT